MRPEIRRLLSGGQTGVDRAALDFAIAAGLPYGGWCPRGGWAEDHAQAPGVLARYPALRETPSSDPAQRTRWNVRDSDALLVLQPAAGAESPGTELAREVARELERPFATVELDGGEDQARGLLATLLAACSAARITLNVAGPRESEAPGIYEASRRLVEALLCAPPG